MRRSSRWKARCSGAAPSRDLGAPEPADLAFVRLKANGEVLHESILEHDRKSSAARSTCRKTPGRGWSGCSCTIADPKTGYLSRALPFREGEIDGDYDHLARVLEWSAGGDGPDEDDGE